MERMRKKRRITVYVYQAFFSRSSHFFPPRICAHVCMSVLWFCRFIVVPAIMVALQYDYVHYTIATILNKVHFHAYVKHVLVIKYISFFFLFHSFSVSFFCLAFAVDSWFYYIFMHFTPLLLAYSSESCCSWWCGQSSDNFVRLLHFGWSENDWSIPRQRQSKRVGQRMKRKTNIVHARLTFK